MLSALDLARRIEAGDLTPAAVIDMCAEAVAARESEIGAFVVHDFPAARRHAEAQAAKLRTAPLRGLPVGFKDIFETADFPTAYGTPIYAGYRPPADAALVSMVRRAGGLIPGKTVTTALAFLDPAATRNPRNPAHTPGGSSSGSAAAIAAGMLPISVGSQTGGSVVRPAAYCGVTGFKPSYRLLPSVGMKPFSWFLDTPGLFAASVPDVAFAAEAITGRDLRVGRSAPAAPRIALVRMHIWNEASADMHAAVETAARRAEKAGASVHEVTLPQIFVDAYNAHGTIQDYEVTRALAYEYDNHRDALPKVLHAALDKAMTVTAAAYDDARRTAKRARRALLDVMDGHDAILTPSAPGAAPAGLATTGSAIFNRLWTLLGTPCVNVTGLNDADGLPLGIQVIGPFGDDRETLEAALFVERALAS
jgi:Asp-tRNA(Asn)/Glu-tRNA(Gln) amidotransferase A subunit family amidase